MMTTVIDYGHPHPRIETEGRETMDTTAAANETLRDALARYFAKNGFGADGGYDDAWVDFELGPIPLPFPNSAGRKRAVRLHDLHHILTSYETDTLGEFEISAWEIGAGCGDFYTAWIINLAGMTGGIFSAPKRTFHAFRRGRASRTLYGESYEQALEEDVATARAKRVHEPAPTPTATELVSFAAHGLVGLVMGLGFAALVVPLLPIGLIQILRKRKQKSVAANA